MKTEEEIHVPTINREIGAWLRELRQQWMVPIGKHIEKHSDAKPYWGFWKRFACAFVGVFTFVATLLLVRFENLGVVVRPDSTILHLQSNILVLSIPYLIWFSWLVSWRDFGHGPVRLFLGGVFMPSLVWAVVSFAIK